MIRVIHASGPSSDSVIEAFSNQSMSLDRLMAVFALLAAVTLLVALGPALHGFWPIMVAALVHVILTGWCMRTAWRANWARERVVVSADRLTIHHQDVRHNYRQDWPAAWVRVDVDRKRSGEHCIFVSCHGQRQAIGTFLPWNERLELAQTLKECLGPVSGWGDGKQIRVSQG